MDARGETLLQSRGFTSPQEAGRTIALLQAQRGQTLTTLAALAGQLEPIGTEETRAVTEALEALAEATPTTSGS